MESHKQNSLPPAQLLLLLQHLQLLLLPHLFQLIRLPHVQILQFLEDNRVSKILLRLLEILKMLEKTYWDRLQYRVGCIGTFWVQNITQNTGNSHKDIELFQVFIHDFLCQNVPIFLLYILLTRRIDTFCSEGIDKQKISNIHKDFLSYINFNTVRTRFE